MNGIYYRYVILLLITFGANQGISQNYLNLKEVVYIKKDSIFINDLLINNNKISFFNNNNIFITKSPLYKRNRILKADFLNSILSKYGVQNYHCKYDDKVIIKNYYDTVSISFQKKIIKNFFTSKYKDLNFKIKSNLLPIYIPLRKNKIIKVDNLLNKNIYGNNIFYIKIFLDGKIYKKIPITCYLFSLKKVFVATKSISRGEKLSLSYKIVMRDIAKNIRAVLAKDINIENYVARKNIRLGDVINKNDIKKRSVITRGDKIDLVHQQPGINLTIEGESLGNYGPGEMGAFRSSLNRKIIYAKVIDSKMGIIR